MTFTVDKDKKLYEQINNDNWTQGRLFKYSEGQICAACAVGWLNLKYSYKDVYAIECVMMGKGLVGPLGLAAFNDHASTTVDDVIDIFKRADI